MHAGSFSAKAINVSRLTLRRITTAPDASRPTTLQTFLPRSTPSTEISIPFLLLNRRRAYDAGRRGESSHKTLRAAEQNRPDVAEARAAWRDEQKRLDPRRLVFIDETPRPT